MKDFKSFIKKLITFLIIIAAFDYVIGNLLNHYYFTQESGDLYRLTNAVDKTKADILIFGSSRAKHHYQPSIFEKNTNQTCYNVGQDGGFVFTHYAILQCVLKRYAPKMIIYDYDITEFEVNQDSYDRISRILPYHDTHPEIEPIIKLKSPNENIKLISGIYPFNSLILSIAVGNMEFNELRREDIKGYVPLTNILKENKKSKSDSFSNKIDSVKIKIFESFIRDCLKSNIKIFLVCSPCYRNPSSYNYSIRMGEDIADKYKIKYYDFSHDSTFCNKALYFADPTHLNDRGATIFSKCLVDSLFSSKVN